MVRIRFQLDEHVPHAVARALRRRGIDVLTASDAGLRGAPDSEYFIRSHAEGWVIVTQDADFLRLHFQQQPHAGIVYYQQSTTQHWQVVEGLLLIHEVLEPTEMIGRLEFL